MFIDRKIYPEIHSYLNKKQIIVITGMRRTGKTTILKKLLEDSKNTNKIYFDLERFDNREIFSEKNYDNILLALQNRGMDLKKPVIVALDEIQFIPNIPSVLKYLYDHYNVKFIVTGSSSYYIKNLFSESLSGRKIVFELNTLTFAEFLRFKNIKKKFENFINLSFNKNEYERIYPYYENYIKYGGFPDVALSENDGKIKNFLNDLISSYINIDIKSIADFRKTKDIYNLLKILASRAGNKIDYSKISILTGISRSTLVNYMEFLEKTYIIKRINVHSNNPDREITKAQKLYFCDNGILNILGDVWTGQQFENCVFNQLKNSGKISYYSLKKGNEIDFILDKKTAFEVKETPASFDLQYLEKISKTAKIKNHRLIGRHRSINFDNYIWGGDIV
jgi:uncharacterized protein